MENSHGPYRLTVDEKLKIEDEINILDTELAKMEYLSKHPTLMLRFAHMKSEVDNWAIVLTYLSAGKLVKGTDNLVRHTVHLKILTIVLGLLAIAQIVLLCIQKWG